MSRLVNGSSIVLGAVVEIDGEIVEDMKQLRPKNDCAKINVSELDAVYKGINMALKWYKHS